MSKLCSLCVVGCVFLIGMADHVAGATYNQDFEADPEWVFEEDYGASVFDLIQEGENRALYAKHKNTYDGGGWAAHDVGPFAGSFCLEWDIQIGVIESGSGFQFGLYDSTKASVGGKSIFLAFFDNASGTGDVALGWYDGSIPIRGYVGSPDRYTKGAWYHVAMAYEASLATVSAVITEDGTELMTLTMNAGPFDSDMTFVGTTQYRPIASGGTHHDLSATAEASIDNVSFSSSNVPEPTSLVLWAGLGIVGLVSMRRRRT